MSEEIDCSRLEFFELSVQPLNSGIQSPARIRLQRSEKNFSVHAFSGNTEDFGKRVNSLTCTQWSRGVRAQLNKIENLAAEIVRKPASTQEKESPCIQIVTIQFKVDGSSQHPFRRRYCMTGRKDDKLGTMLQKLYATSEGFWFQ